MQVIETAWKQFFSQFAPYVFTEGELIQDPNNILYPRITFSYSMGDFFDNTITTFQVWDWSHNNSGLWAVCDKISQAIPVESGTEITIPGETYFEYLNPDTWVWIRFDNASDFQAIADKFAPQTVEWRTVEKETSGAIEIKRGTPFSTPSPKDEAMSRCQYGTLQARYLNTI